MKTNPVIAAVIAALTSGALMSQSAAQITVGGDGPNTTDSTSYSGAQSLTKIGSNTVTLTGGNTYTGGTTINAGALAIGANNRLPDVGQVTINSGSVFDLGSFGEYVGSLTMNGNATVSGTSSLGQLILTTGLPTNSAIKTLMANGAGNIVTAGIGISSSHGGVGGNSDLRFDVVGASDNLALSGVINDKSSDGGGTATRGAISKAGQGTLLLLGTNTYTGRTSILEGTVVAANSRALGAGGVFVDTMTTVSAGATLALQGNISMDEHMHIFGSGVGGLGAIRNLSGSNALTATGYALRSDVTLGADAGQLTISGAIGQEGGAYGMTKVGAGTLLLSGVNTYSGGTRVNAGTLVIGAGGTLLNIGTDLTANNGGTITFARRDVLGLHTDSIAMPVVLNEGGLLQNSGAVFNTLGALNLNGGTLQANDVEPSSGQSFALKGAVTVTGNATSTIAGNGIALGAAAVTGTTFNVGDGASETDLLVTGVLRDGSGATFGPAQVSSLTKTGAGAMVLAGSNAYTGTTTISAGALQIGNGGTNGTLGTGAVTNNASLVFNRANALAVANVISGTGSVAQNGAGTTTLSGANTYTGATTINGGTLATSGDNRIATSNSVTVNAAGTFALGGNQTLASVTGSGAIQLGDHILTTGASNSTYSGTMAGNGGLTKSGAGTFTLSGVGTFTGDTTLTGGTLVLANANALSSDAVVIMNAGTTLTVNQRTFIGALEQGGGTVNGPGQLVSTLTLTSNGSLNAVLADGPDFAAGILKRTSGTTTIGAANTFTGAVKIQGGTLELGAGGSFAAGSSLVLSAGATMDLNNKSQTFSAVSGQGGTLAMGSGSLTVNQSTDTAYNGVVTGTGSLTKQGAGTLTLGGNNTYSGGTTVSGGKLAGTTASLKGAVTNNAQVEFAQDTDGTYSGNMAGSGALIKSGTGTVTLSGSNTHSGGTTISDGKLVAGTANLQGNMANNAAFEISQNSNGTYAGDISGSGSLSKSGTGTVTLSGSNTYSGGTTVSAGKLVGNSASLQGDVTNNAAVEFNQAGSGTYLGAMDGTGSLAKSGTGTLVMSGNSTYTGATTVQAGQLTVDGSITSTATVQSGARIGGSGRVGGLILNSGSTLAPGNSPGSLSVTGDATWNSGANYNWQVLATNTNPAVQTGAGTGWDFLDVTGTLTFSGLDSSNRFNLNLWSLSSTSPDTNGTIPGWDPSVGSTWLIASAAGGINLNGTSLAANTNYSSLFNINTAATNGSGGWSGALPSSFQVLTLGDANALYLQAVAGSAAVPEPGQVAASLLLLAGIGGYVWMQRRKAAKTAASGAV